MKKLLTPEDLERKAELKKAKAALAIKARKQKRRKNAKVSDRTAKRTSRMKPEEREKLRLILIGHYGASMIDKAILKCATLKEQEAIFVEFRYRMEREVEAQEEEVSEYLKKIDAEYKTVGRPKSVFNWREMDYLCSIGCTLEEIAGLFQMDVSTVRERVKEEFGITFNQYYERNSQGIKIALRRRQLKLAMDGDGAMLKFLGKNILGQKEKVEFDGQVKVNSWVDLINNLESGIPTELDAAKKEDEE